MADGHLLTTMVCLPFVGCIVAAFLPKHARNAAAGLAWTVSLVGIGLALWLYPKVANGGVVRQEIPWLPALGCNFVLRLDGLSWLFSLLVLGIGALVVLYARYYMSPKDPVPRFFTYLLAFMGAMTGVILSGNLIEIVVFWELTSVFSFLLIGYWRHNPNAREGAKIALTVTATGGLCLLVGMILLGWIAGSFDLDQVLASGEIIRASPFYLPALLLILGGALTKSAQFPFHFWLPQAMAAPTPVSAYLHSATMVKAGVFLLIRLWPVLSGTEGWSFVLESAGVASLVLGAYCAVYQHDLKGLLAYSTISHLGLIVLLLGLGSPLALVAAIFHTVNHATFKASLFMAAGIIDHETGTRDMRRLSGLFRYMPITATLAMVAAAAMAGVPLLNGFLSKEMFLAVAVDYRDSQHLNYALPVLATLASALSVLYSLRFIHQTFFGPPPVDLPREPHEPPRWMRFPIEALVLICVVVGIIPGLTIGPFLAVAVRAVLGDEAPEYSLAIWHGFTPALFMSLTALIGGAGLYSLLRDRINAATTVPSIIGQVRGVAIYDAVLRGANAVARFVSGGLNASGLQAQLRILMLASLALGLAAAGGLYLGEAGVRLFTPLDPVFALMWLIGCVCAVGAASQAKYHRLAAVVLTGGAGLISCLSFVWLSAPDLAITQLLVEIVTTVLLLLGLRWLPKRREEIARSPGGEMRRRTRRGLDLGVAVLAGLATAVVAYAVMTRPAPEGLARFFLEHAYSQGGGRNVVNVLLVDFRAFDTLGEITVLAAVAITVFALLRRFRPAADSLPQPEQQRIQNAYDDAREDRAVGDTLADSMRVPRLIMRWLFPVIAVLAAHLFLRGHDAPGGGFAAGVAFSIAIILQYMGSGARWVEDHLRVHPQRWIGAGLLAAAATGAGSLLFGYPFLTTYFRYLQLPVFGKTPLATALAFDLGVFLLVVGATVLMLIALAHQSLRTPRRPRSPADGEAAPAAPLSNGGV